MAEWELLGGHFKFSVLAVVSDKSVVADADILESDVTIPGNGILRTGVALSGATTFKLKLTHNATEKVILYNMGSDLTADALYLFDFPVCVNDKVNFRAGSACTVQILNASEITTL